MTARRTMQRLVFAAFVVVFAIGASACSSSKKVRPPQPPINYRGKTSVAVDAQDDLFTPPNIIIDPGTKVTWTNKDTVPHNVKKAVDFINFGAPFGVDADKFGPGKSYSFTFKADGTYHYTCTIHAGMTGEVIVGNGGNTPIITPPARVTTTSVP